MAGKKLLEAEARGTTVGATADMILVNHPPDIASFQLDEDPCLWKCMRRTAITMSGIFGAILRIRKIAPFVVVYNPSRPQIYNKRVL